MFISKSRSHSSPRGPVEKTDLDKEGLVNLFQCVLFLRQAGSQRIEPNRAAIIFFR